MGKIKFAVVGCGHIGKRHAEMISRNKESELVALIDVKKKEELKTSLKELHSERISLESEITNSSKQTEIAEKLKSTGLKELTSPPIKLTRDATQ